MAVQVTGQDETPLHYSELRATRRNLLDQSLIGSRNQLIEKISIVPGFPSISLPS